MVTHYPNGDVEFRFFRPNAQRVCLVGDFNGWRRSEAAMRKRGDGWWSRRLRLGPGAYQFQYLADGERYLDFAAFGVERGPLGGWNSVVVVGQPTGAKTPGRRELSRPATAAAGREA
ncbi:MAG TPA: isoamylase early set domain-containing protein [Phycisphaerae bacterium]|nr:isoamylase early set domain-containing protein [Phycisphaerae bacterium]HRY68920.1 isoamylase early set domain-containing protein [Phycisphaerae bacterium]HSA25747.1 isoamylase early set domain-containing protein [Phycisphaerae bacterium]